MKTRQKEDIISIFKNFQESLSKKPSLKQMYEELRMMRFRVRPMQGDVAMIDLENKELIETLWNLGKLDELYHREYPKLSSRGKNIFFRIFDNMHQKLQSNLNNVNLKAQTQHSKQSIFEMEIFKERISKRKLN